MLNPQLLQKICSYYDIASLKESPVLLLTSGMHPVWQLATENKKFALKYYDHALRALYAKNLLPLEQVEQIAASMQQKNISTITALPGKIGYEFQTQQGSFFLYEWIEGEHRLEQQISENHARQIGALSHDIHNIKTNVPQRLMQSHYLAEALQVFQTKYPNILSSEELMNLNNWYQQSLKQSRTVHQLVFSHRDIMPANVFWLSDKKYLLLDWEFCGYIQRDLDIFITALNWSDVTSGKINLDLFSAVIAGYLSQPTQVDFQWDVLLFEYYAYVLHWVEFNLKRSVYFSAQYQQAALEVKKSYMAMDFVTKKYRVLFEAVKKITHI